MADRPTLKKEDDRREPKPGEKLVMAGSALLVAFLLGYMAWQAIALQDASPEAALLSTRTLPSGDVEVTVTLSNPGAKGLRDVAVEVKCGDQPPEILFSFVPAHATRKGTAVCPPGTQAPEVGITFYVEA